jgi:quercetin dioxygenase-like cupin family protein
MNFNGEKSNIGELDVTLVHRSNNFQVEFFSLPPNYIVLAHTHPNVDSFEVYIDGQLKFSLGGEIVFFAK